MNELDVELIDCPECEGKDETCWLCHGKGKIDTYENKQYQKILLDEQYLDEFQDEPERFVQTKKSNL